MSSFRNYNKTNSHRVCGSKRVSVVSKVFFNSTHIYDKHARRHATSAAGDMCLTRAIGRRGRRGETEIPEFQVPFARAPNKQPESGSSRIVGRGEDADRNICHAPDAPPRRCRRYPRTPSRAKK